MRSNTRLSHPTTVSSYCTRSLCVLLDFFWLTGTPFHPFQQEPGPHQSYVDLMLLNTVKANSTLFLLVPTAGWVDAGKIEEGCGSFPISEYGHQQSEYQRWGNGVYPNGTLLRGDWRCYVPFQLKDVMEWLQHVRDVVGGDTFDRHVVLQLDNEYDICQRSQQATRNARTHSPLATLCPAITSTACLTA